MQKQYWAFYWPLTLTGLAMLLAKQFENGVLARYPNAATELAIVAYAWSIFQLFNAALIFTSQMVNRLARTREDRQVCFRFLLGVCSLLTLPLAVTAFLPVGRALVTQLFGVEGSELSAVIAYLRFLTPMVFVNGFRHFHVGLLIQARRTQAVTILNVVYLTTSVALLLFGFSNGWRPLYTLACSQITASVGHLLLSVLLVWVRRVEVPMAVEGEAAVTFGDVLAFFWPVALTSIMFACSRPILYSFVSRTANAVVTVAAMRVAFDLAMIFHNPANQSRNLYVTFGVKDREGLQVFVTRLMLVLSLVMVVVASSPLLGWVMGSLLGVDESILEMARETFWVLCLVPIAITLRNMVHGTALASKRTTGMGVGGVSRNVVIYLGALCCYHLGWLNHQTAAAILVAGFASERVVVHIWLRVVEGIRGPMLQADVSGALGLRRLEPAARS